VDGKGALTGTASAGVLGAGVGPVGVGSGVATAGVDGEVGSVALAFVGGGGADGDEGAGEVGSVAAFVFVDGGAGDDCGDGAEGVGFSAELFAGVASVFTSVFSVSAFRLPSSFAAT
jgi:hypothetical protein